MSKPTILVSGATGRTGAVVVAELLKSGCSVRALVRTEDGRSRALRARGVEIAVADMSDPEPIAEALKGVHRAYYLPPVDPAMLHGSAVFATAANDARVEHVVLMTQWLASPAHPSLSTRQHWLTDRVFRMLPNAGLTIVSPGFFADVPYLTALSPAAHLGFFPWPYGDSRNAPPSVDDIGRVAAAALMDPDRHAGKTYRPTGPELLSGEDMALILGRVLGRSVRLAPVPPWIFLKAARLEGVPIAELNGMRDYIVDARRGAFEAGAPTDHVREVTGRPPETFETVTRRHAELYRNRRTFANLLRELIQFLAIPFVPLPLARYESGLHAPRPAHSSYAIDSGVWLAEHGISKSGRPEHATEPVRKSVVTRLNTLSTD